MPDIAGIPSIEVDFDKHGKQLNKAALPAGTTDVFVISHGWNNDKEEARALYRGLVGNIAAQLPGFEITARKFAIVGVFWPSLKIDSKIAAEQSGTGGPSASAPAGKSDAASEAEVIKRLRELQRFLATERLPEHGSGVQSPAQDLKDEIAGAEALVPQLHQTSARDKFVTHIRSLVSDDAAGDEDGSKIFFKFKKGDELMKKLIVDEDDLPDDLRPDSSATSTVSRRGSAAQPSGGAAGIVSFFKGFAGSALNLLNYTAYYEMKTRAGTVGQTGLAPLLDELAQGTPARAIHLIGHSFGGRVVTAAAANSKTDRIESMTLLQAAFSHNGFSEKGFFRSVVKDGRVQGPILVTHTKNDDAVGRAYPLASRLSGDKTMALGDKNDEFGGIGRNGAQKMTGKELDKKELRLREAGEPYAFGSRIFNLEADQFIKSHSDVTGKQIAHAVLSAIASPKGN